MLPLLFNFHVVIFLCIHLFVVWNIIIIIIIIITLNQHFGTPYTRCNHYVFVYATVPGSPSPLGRESGTGLSNVCCPLGFKCCHVQSMHMVRSFVCVPYPVPVCCCPHEC